MHRGFIATMGLLAGITPGVAQGHDSVALNSQMFVEKIRTDLNGRERRILQPAAKISSGDRLVFVLRYRNQGAEPVRHFVVTNPVPGSIQFDAAPARDLIVSVDGGSNWGPLETLKVRTAAGGIRPALPQDVTHIRWTFKSAIRPGDTGQLSFRGTVR